MRQLSVRMVLVIILVIALAIYAWRNWFFSLCGLLAVEGLLRFPDMPTKMMGIQGANLWNLLFASIVVAWVFRGRRQDLQLSEPGARGRRILLPPTPMYIKAVLVLYVGLIFIAFARGLADLAGIPAIPDLEPIRSRGAYISEFLINCLKYVAMAVLFYVGARTRHRMMWGVWAIVVQVAILAVMTIHYIPLSALRQAGTTEHAESPFRKEFGEGLGLHSNDVGLILVAGMWALIVAIPLLRGRSRLWTAMAWSAVLAIVLAIGLTNSRASMLAAGAVGIVFGFLRWRKLLLAVPIAAVVACLLSPSISGRLGLGVGDLDPTGKESMNWDEVSAGRVTNIWPPTIDQIQESPIVGYGRLAILRTPMFYKIVDSEEGSCPTHPHNAYLEILLDAGLIGLVIILAAFVGLPVVAFSARSPDKVLECVRYAGLAGAIPLLVMGFSGQSFWPREAIDVILCLYALQVAGYRVSRSEQLVSGSRASSRPASVPLEVAQA